MEPSLERHSEMTDMTLRHLTATARPFPIRWLYPIYYYPHPTTPDHSPFLIVVQRAASYWPNTK